MKLETSEEERAGLKDWAAMLKRYFYGDAIVGSIPMNSITASRLTRLFRDIDTLLAEVERLRAERRPFSDGLAQKVIDEQVKTIDRLTAKLAAPPAPPLPAEVEEMRKRLATVEADARRVAKSEYYIDTLAETTFKEVADTARAAASLLSRWPGVWRPIETAPKDKLILLFAVTALGDDGKVSNWKMGSGIWLPGYADRIDDLSPWEWNGHQLHKYETQPTHWSPLPEPPHE